MQSGRDASGNPSAPTRLGSAWLAIARLFQIVAVPAFFGIWAIASQSLSMALLFSVALATVAALMVRFHGSLLTSSASLDLEAVRIESLLSRRISTVQLADIESARRNRSWGAVVLIVTGGRRYFINATGRKHIQAWLSELDGRCGPGTEVGESWSGWFPS